MIKVLDSAAPANRAGGVRHNSGRANAKSRARKALTQLELRQYRQQLVEATHNGHKYWVGNDVYNLIDMRQNHPKKRCQVTMGPYWQT